MNPLAKANAVQLLRKYCYSSQDELNVEELLYAEGHYLIEQPLTHAQGEIRFDGSFGLITVDSGITSYGQKRFVIAHELGHFYNEALTQPLPKGEGKALTQPLLKGEGENAVFYRCGFDSFYGSERMRLRESNANDFAAELLMHEEWFTSAAGKQNISKKLLAGLADQFSVSLTAAALRYAEIGYFPTAVLMVKERKIAWKAIHQKFSFQFCKVGSTVSTLSYTDDFFKGSAVPLDGEDIPAEAWFPEDFGLRNKRDARIWELVFPFHTYNSALVMLWEA